MKIERKITALNEPFVHLVIADEIYELAKKNLKDTFKYILIDGKKCMDAESLFNEFSFKMEFPDYFGRNWSAFDECINDLSWLSAQGYVLFISDIDQVLVKEDKDLRILMDILYDCCEEWSRGREYGEFITIPSPFHVILHSNIKMKIPTISRLKHIGIEGIDIIK
ncbi:barstar family protein [Bacillus sp. JJ864]|uniref:barstar family protein n=1 Tax=Bacillus sp. JJ864 TaxID=3122975 RepID=UPI002FFF65F7